MQASVHVKFERAAPEVSGPTRTDWLQSLRQRQADDPPLNPPLRLLFVATSAGQGGLERHSVRLADELQKSGALVYYACAPGSFLESLCLQCNILVLPLRVLNSGDLPAAVHLARFILRHQIEIVHVHSRRDFLVASLGVAGARCFRRGAGRRPGLVLHAHLIKGLGQPPWLSGRFFERVADGVIAVSQATRGFLIDSHAFPAAFVSVLPNGIDVAAYTVSARQRLAWRRETRRQWDVPESALVVGMVGRLNAKGQDTLLQAAPRLLDRFPEVHFVFVGPEGEPGDRERLHETAKASRLPLTLVEGDDPMPKLLTALDVLVHLPAEEAFGLVLVEAMAAGQPIVATDVGGCGEIIENGVTGSLIGLGDEEALIEALSALLCPMGIADRRRMGLAGQCRARREFTLRQQVDALNVMYGSVLD